MIVIPTPEDVKEILFTREQLEQRVGELAERIVQHYQNDGVREVTVVQILHGAAIFCSDLLRALYDKSNGQLAARLDSMIVSSYGKKFESSGKVKIVLDLAESIQGEDVLVVEDIIDSGRTIDYLRGILEPRRPKSLKMCTLLDKPARREVEVHPDYVGFEVEGSPFVVGYGMDCGGCCRDWPFVAVLKPEFYDNKKKKKR